MTAASPHYAALMGNRPEELSELVGLEIVSRAARMVLLRDLELNLTLVADRWRQSDRAIQELGMDVGIGETELEPVLPANLHQGPHRSLIDAPPENFPYIALGAFLGVPDDQNQFDQLSVSAITLGIEVHVKSGVVYEGTELKNETIVDRRINRTLEAINITIAESKNLLGTVLPIERLPRTAIFDQKWVSGLDTGEQRYLQQGGRLQYTLQRTTAL